MIVPLYYNGKEFTHNGDVKFDVGMYNANITLIGKSKSKKQRAYFHGVVCKHFQRILENYGDIVSLNQAKEKLKYMFLSEDVEILGDKFKYVRNTEDLNMKDYREFIEKCVNWMVSEFQEPIPESLDNYIRRN